MADYRSAGLEFSILLLAICTGCVGDSEHPTFDHRCEKDAGLGWDNKNLALHHNEPRTCPVKISRSGQQVVFTATAIQQPVSDPGDVADYAFGEVRNSNGELVSAQLIENFAQDLATGNWKATVSGYYQVGTTAQYHTTGTDVGFVYVTFETATQISGRVYLTYRIGSAIASIAGQGEIPPNAGCQYTGSVEGEFIVSWRWYVNYQLAGDAQTFVLRSGGVGDQYPVQLVARDADGYDYEAWIYPTVTESAAYDNCGW